MKFYLPIDVFSSLMKWSHGVGIKTMGQLKTAIIKYANGDLHKFINIVHGCYVHQIDLEV